MIFDRFTIVARSMPLGQICVQMPQSVHLSGSSALILALSTGIAFIVFIKKTGLMPTGQRLTHSAQRMHGCSFFLFSTIEKTFLVILNYLFYSSALPRNAKDYLSEFGSKPTS